MTTKFKRYSINLDDDSHRRIQSNGRRFIRVYVWPAPNDD